MKIYAISDLHLSTSVNKPMDIFGDKWSNYFDTVREDWNERVTDEDVVFLCGDFSWAMRLDEVRSDFQLFDDLKGRKVILRGNHDYWWATLSQVKSVLPKGFQVLQNNCLRFDEYLVCGTRGWLMPDEKTSPEDIKIHLREIERFKLSLNEMEKMRRPDDKVIALFHFPPFNVRREESEFVRLMVKHGISTAIYGHLHGKDCRADLFFNKFNINFYLTSTDLVKHKLVQIF